MSQVEFEPIAALNGTWVQSRGMFGMSCSAYSHGGSIFLFPRCKEHWWVQWLEWESGPFAKRLAEARNWPRLACMQTVCHPTWAGLNVRKPLPRPHVCHFPPFWARSGSANDRRTTCRPRIGSVSQSQGLWLAPDWARTHNHALAALIGH